VVKPKIIESKRCSGAATQAASEAISSRKSSSVSVRNSVLLEVNGRPLVCKTYRTVLEGVNRGRRQDD
jgi:hypothetical protein